MTDDALVAALVELEHHVGEAGWDQPARLFALVRTDELIAAEPELAAHLGLRSSAEGHPPGALSSIEQDDFRSVGAGEGTAASESALHQVLGRITWPDAVTGCALSLERTFLPAAFEADLPADPAEAERFVAEHPERQDLRLVVGVLRDGAAHCFARLVSNPEDLLSSPDLAPGVVSVLAATLDHDQPGHRLRQDSRRTT
ncbi:PPA1309 family protein [Granulicoccus sp. GXG6511]|uniref:PPA1309 family protein n=1 Tax=Granulicoccus sp. GXG6511 TaxID=3381351 RepID=UPI003D7C9482